jgi:MFS family permease
MAVSNVALFGGSFLTPVFVGKITDSLGWQWTFYFVAIFTGVAFPFMFFFVPETAFRRANYLNTDFSGKVDYDQFQHDSRHHSLSESQTPLDGVPGGDGHSSSDPRNQLTDYEKDDGAVHNGEAPQHRSTNTSYWRRLALFNGRKTEESFFKLLLRPFPLFLQPGVLWVSHNTLEPVTACINQI